MTTTTDPQPLSQAMTDGLRAFYFHTTTSYTGGDSGTVERLNEHGGTLHGQHRYMPAMRQQTMAALKRRGLVTGHYDPRSRYGSQHFQLTPAGHDVLFSLGGLLTYAEQVAIDIYWQEQAMAEDLIRDQLADEAERSVDRNVINERGNERSRRYLIDNRMHEGFQAIQEALSDSGAPADRDSARRELTRRQAARHPMLTAQQVEADERGELHRNRFTSSTPRSDATIIDFELQSYAEQLKALSLVELIDRHARIWHRAANQPNNAEMVQLLHMVKQMIARNLEGWVPLDEVESWCDR